MLCPNSSLGANQLRVHSSTHAVQRYFCARFHFSFWHRGNIFRIISTRKKKKLGHSSRTAVARGSNAGMCFPKRRVRGGGNSLGGVGKGKTWKMRTFLLVFFPFKTPKQKMFFIFSKVEGGEICATVVIWPGMKSRRLPHFYSRQVITCSNKQTKTNQQKAFYPVTRPIVVVVLLNWVFSRGHSLELLSSHRYSLYTNYGAANLFLIQVSSLLK